MSFEEDYLALFWMSNGKEPHWIPTGTITEDGKRRWMINPKAELQYIEEEYGLTEDDKHFR